MSEKINNPNAFPTMEHGYDRTGISTVFTSEGMTLRDYFAAKAMVGIMSSDPKVNGRPWTHKDFEALSGYFYKLADTMLKERQKTKDE